MSKNTLEKIFRWADAAPLRLKILAKIRFYSDDPTCDFEGTRRLMGSVFRGQVTFREKEDTVAGELSTAFTPGTDLGDLLLIAHGNERALDRFVERHPQPIYHALWNSFRREFREGVRHQGGIALLAARHGAGVLSRGWDTKRRRGPNAKKKPSRMGRKPLEKTVDLGDGSPVILREPTPLDLIEVLAGDAATLGDRLLRVSIMGSGGWRARSPEDVDVFLREGYFSPEELAILLREARGFVAECIMHGRGAAFYEMNQTATAVLSGGRTRSEMWKARREIDGGEEILMEEGPPPEDDLIEKEMERSLRDRLQDRLTDRERAIVKALEEGKTLKKFAVEEGLSYGYVRNLRSKLGKKIPSLVK